MRTSPLAQYHDLGRREEAGQNEEAVLPEVLDLRWGQLHGGVPSAMSRQDLPGRQLADKPDIS